MFSRQVGYQTIDGEDDTGPLIDHGEEPSFSGTTAPVRYQTSRARNNSTSAGSSRGPTRWDHIENLDQFFHLVYKYHQNNGYLCIALKQSFALFQFIFIVAFSTFIFGCVDYDVVFHNKNTDSSGQNITGKLHVSDAIIPQCGSAFPASMVLAILLAVLFWLFHLLRFVYHMVQFREIQEFYNDVLGIPDSQLLNVTWRSIVEKICDVQPKLRLSVSQSTMSELDIYARILRHRNYFVAMVYDEVLPPSFTLPLIGTFKYLPAGLKVNLEYLLFRCPWSLWKNHYQIKDEVMQFNSFEVPTQNLKKAFLIAALVNFIFMPFIFVYQVLYSFFSYADFLKREPGVFGMRKYSNYGRERLRHFNELDHELRVRLNCSYEFAVRYMDQFISPVTEILAKYVSFIAASVFAVLLLLTSWDEDVLTFDHVITVMSISAALVVAARSFIGDENLVFCPDFLMKQIVANIHYAPQAWLNEAHSSEVVTEFGKLFHLRVFALVLDIVSPVMTPLVLLSMSTRTHEIVQFFKQKTRIVPELGHVCTYAMMDLTTDGNEYLASICENDAEEAQTPNVFSTAHPNTKGKVELSLLNFATQHPNWRPPASATKFLNQIRGKLNETGVGQQMLHSLRDLSRPIAQPFLSTVTQGTTLPYASHPTDDAIGGGGGVIADSALTSSIIRHHTQHNFAQPTSVQERNISALEMSFGALQVTQMLQSAHAMMQGSNVGGYGSFAPLQGDHPLHMSELQQLEEDDEYDDHAVPPLGNTDSSPEEGPNPTAGGGNGPRMPFHSLMQPSTNAQPGADVENSIWGVPSDSQYHND